MYTAYQEITFLSRPVLVGTLRIFIPGLLLMLGLLFGYYNSELNHRISVLKTTDIDQLASSKQRLLKDLHTAISDLEILSEHRAFREVLTLTAMRGSQPHPALWSSTSLPRSRPVFGVCNIEKEHSDSTTEFSIKP